ncbi:hypothetical protein MmiHf6_14490 [Methanimicrococcus hongohii]|uniref:Uncharacterized protein n=1 Tax=Methanimicrococcus hongohii TaxID=3028295 RepID=A0AA96V2G5_9EURY|nr:hypothetical protein [Methanimicrococcus sp. Hf6]WNY24120.1 hypothetical protein MmiHf6_14490 [Methanimicrococcus sp. Hf6]
MDKIPKILIGFIVAALILAVILTGVLYLDSQKQFNESMPNESELLEMIRESGNLRNPEILRVVEDGDENYRILVALFHDKTSEGSSGFLTIDKTRQTLTGVMGGGSESFSYGEEGARRITTGGLRSNNMSYFYFGSINCDPRIASYKIEYYAPDSTLQIIERKVEEKTFLELHEGEMVNGIVCYDEDGNDITADLWEPETDENETGGNDGEN